MRDTSNRVYIGEYSATVQMGTDIDCAKLGLLKCSALANRNAHLKVDGKPKHSELGQQSCTFQNRFKGFQISASVCVLILADTVHNQKRQTLAIIGE